MEDIFKTIFNACKDLTWLKQVSADEGQLEAIDDNGNYKPVALLPCLLIDVQNVQWEAGDLLNQYGTAQVVTRFAYRKTNDQSNLTETALFDASLTIIRQRSEIDKQIANTNPTLHGKLQRLTTERERRSDGIIVFKTTWVCSVTETLV